MTTPLDLVAYNRKWLRLHEHNKYQAEAARRITALLDEVERLRRGRNIWRAMRDQAREDLAALLAERDRLAATVDRVAAIVEPPHIATLENLSEVIDCARAAIEGTDS